MLKICIILWVLYISLLLAVALRKENGICNIKNEFSGRHARCRLAWQKRCSKLPENIKLNINFALRIFIRMQGVGKMVY